jgi:hypothetical protein
MTKRQIEKQLAEFGLRLERRARDFVEQPNGESWIAHWIIRPDTVGSCMAREVTPLRRLADAEDVIDRLQIDRDLAEQTHGERIFAWASDEGFNPGHRRT